MAKKYIEADALRDELHKHEDYKGGLSYEWEAIIADFPAADVRENVRGEWVIDDKGSWPITYCSECGASSTEVGNFCPNCGCQMVVLE